jgi:hypothetical protein
MTSSRTASMVPRDPARTLAQGLGWFSIALGATEVLAPGRISRWLGMKDSEPVLQAYGVREIATGIGILASDNPSGWLWGRVAGDGLDLATLAGGLDESDANTRNIGMALVAVLGVTALDVLCARRLARQNKHARPGQRQRFIDYGNRSGFPKSAQQMRGAARDFEVPADMRTPAPLRPWEAVG